MILKSGLKIDRYVVETSLSQKGGTSSVYLAHLEQEPKSKVALKIAQTNDLGSTHEDALLQFEAELLETWDWRHPGIVRLFPTPLDGRRKPEYVVRATNLKNQPWYMAMEYLRGKSLDENLSVIQKFPIGWKLELFYQIILPIAFIHKKGYAHRDLKPSNIVFREPISPDATPQPVLIDFALAANGNEERVIVANSYTLEYASPERILRSMGMENAPVGNVQATDIWSLGIILYEILTGRSVLTGSKENIRTTIIREQLTPSFPNIGNEYELLVQFVAAMLKKEPHKRPTIKELLYALEETFLPPRIE
jgi:serine/threonine protein kinase